MKSNYATRDARVNECFKMLVEGATRADIQQYAAKNWQITERPVDAYIAAANKLLEKDSKTIRESEIGKAANRLNSLYAKALEIQDYKTCLAIQKEIANLFGYNAPTQTEVSGKGGTDLKIIVEYVNDDTTTTTDTPS